MGNYLVFEADTNHMHAQQIDALRDDVLVGYKPIGGVAAEDPEAAVMAIMGVTRRIGKYCAVEASFIDFGTNLVAPDASRPQLNP